MISLVISAFIGLLFVFAGIVGYATPSIFPSDNRPDWSVMCGVWFVVTIFFWPFIQGLRNSLNGTGPYDKSKKK